jgi:hypothetical protein
MRRTSSSNGSLPPSASARRIGMTGGGSAHSPRRHCSSTTAADAKLSSSISEVGGVGVAVAAATRATKNRVRKRSGNMGGVIRSPAADQPSSGTSKPVSSRISRVTQRAKKPSRSGASMGSTAPPGNARWEGMNRECLERSPSRASQPPAASGRRRIPEALSLGRGTFPGGMPAGSSLNPRAPSSARRRRPSSEPPRSARGSRRR